MQQYSLLLVDDSPEVLNALSRTFRIEGYQIYTAVSAKKALDIIETTDIDLLITDERMPGTAGTTLLEMVAQRHPEIIRFMITGARDIEVAERAINLGAVRRFFTKPWDDDELALAVRQALRERQAKRDRLRECAEKDHETESLRQLEKTHPGITRRRMSADGTYEIE